MNKTSIFYSTSELLITAFAISVLFILFIPIPSGLLDVLLLINLSWALTILLLTFYTDKPLSFSTFPALLLITTLFRLALNISATRLILTDGNAGKVISAMGTYVIQGNYVMGLVVFLILIIVQFIVVTNGAQRVAEVAARFTLDSMPGKQMSIDADLNMGSISQAEAKIRRSQIEKEANFYGAMDGASKFVKGDAIAGILIMLVDIIGGFSIGLMQKGLSLSQSIQTYTLLTVGDGLVTQIPALIISTATGIIVTRVATDTHLGSEVVKQISAYPKILMMVCFSLLSLLCLKGIPTLPVLGLLIFFILIAWFAKKTQSQEANTPNATIDLYEQIKILPIEINLNKELYNELKIQELDILESISQLREKIALDMGFVIPDIGLKIDHKLNYPMFSVAILGNSQGVHALYNTKLLAIESSKVQKPIQELPDGIKVQDPTYGLPSIWLDTNQQDLVKNLGYTVCAPTTVLATHLQEVVQSNLSVILTRQETEKVLNQAHVKSLCDELIPSLLPLSHVQRILQNLLQEKVSIRYITQIIEVLLEHAKKITDPAQLTELVRARLSTPICQKLLAHQDCLHVLTLDSVLEQELNQCINPNDLLILEPRFMERFIGSLANQVEQMLHARKRPILLCSSLLRRHIKQLTQRVIPHLTVLGMNEIPIHIQVESFAQVNS